jgi:hypothetical protein
MNGPEMTKSPGSISLSDLVEEKITANSHNPFVYSPFGRELDGQFINPWLSNYGRIAFFTRSLGVSDFTTQSIIDVFVPATRTGMIPMNMDEQPYSWNGKINAAAAESALWYAFGIITDAEAVEFMRNNCPEVIFQYIDKSRFHKLTVQFIGGVWRVTGIED